MRPRPRVAALLLLVTAVVATSALAEAGPGPLQPAETESPSGPRSLFEHANSLFRRALDASEADPAGSRRLFEAAAAAYRTLAVQHRIESAGLLTNLGNAEFLAGATGRAVLAYRRALAIDPRHAGALDGLAAARRAIGSAPAAPSVAPGLGWIGAWRGVIDDRWLVGCAVGLWWLAWASAGLRRVAAKGSESRPSVARWLTERVPPAWLGPVFAAIAAVVAAPVAADALVARDASAGVITATTVARRGPGSAIYERAFAEPVPAGAEVTVRDRRGGWTRVVLADGRDAWVEVAAVELVRRPGA